MLTRRVLGLSSVGAAIGGPKSAASLVRRAPLVAPAAAGMRIDSHVHVWAPPEQRGCYPFASPSLPGAPQADPPMPGSAEQLLSQMDAAGVQGALIVQPTNYLFDHSYVSAAIEAHPSRFAGCLLADPSPGGGGVAQMEALAATGLFRAVRFNPYIWPNGEKMTNEAGRALFAKAGELGLPVGFMPFKGLLLHIDEIEELISSYPRTTVILDHFGFCKAEDTASEEWRRLLALARHPQVYVKSSAFFRVSKQPYPYVDASRGALRTLVDAFGAERVMWGTDWPWVDEHGGYTKAWSILDAPPLEGQPPPAAAALTPEERAWVEGGTLAKLLPGAFGAGPKP